MKQQQLNHALINTVYGMTVSRNLSEPSGDAHRNPREQYEWFLHNCSLATFTLVGLLLYQVVFCKGVRQNKILKMFDWHGCHFVVCAMVNGAMVDIEWNSPCFCWSYCFCCFWMLGTLKHADNGYTAEWVGGSHRERRGRRQGWRYRRNYWGGEWRHSNRVHTRWCVVRYFLGWWRSGISTWLLFFQIEIFISIIWSLNHFNIIFFLVLFTNTLLQNRICAVRIMSLNSRNLSNPLLTILIAYICTVCNSKTILSC